MDQVNVPDVHLSAPNASSAQEIVPNSQVITIDNQDDRNSRKEDNNLEIGLMAFGSVILLLYISTGVIVCLLKQTKTANQKNIVRLTGYETHNGGSLGVDLQNPPRSHFLLRNMNFEEVVRLDILPENADPVERGNQANATPRQMIANSSTVLPTVSENQRPRIEFINVHNKKPDPGSSEQPALMPNMRLRDVIQYISAPVQPYQPLRTVLTEHRGVHQCSRSVDFPIVPGTKGEEL